MPEMISLEEARALVLSHAAPLPVETVPVLEAVGRVAVISIGSELVDPTVVPTPGKIRNSNSYALAACAQAAGAVPVILPIVEDTKEALAAAVWTNR